MNTYKNNKINRQEKLSIHILKLIGLGLVITTVSILSPTFLYGLIRGYLKYRKFKSYNKTQIQKSISYLKRKNFVAYENSGGKTYLILTKLGRRHLTGLEFEQIKINRPAVWDNKWRILFFDIPEAKASNRQIFRLKLRDLEFYHVQRSVFISPYPCEKEISKIVKYLEIQPYIFLVTASRFSHDRRLRKKFNL